MSTFVPTKRNLREALLFCFHLKKKADESHRLLCEAYGDHVSTISTCEYWLRQFKNGDFNTEDKEREGRPETVEDAELEALLNDDSCQTQEELAESLGVTQQEISLRLKTMGMVQKKGNWVYELKPKDMKRRVFTCEYLLQRQIRKDFLHRIVTGDEKWIHYDDPMRKKSWGYPGHASTSTAKSNIHGSKLMLCIWWDQLGVIYYELLEPNETITGDRYQLQLMRLSQALKEKRPEYEQRHDKVILLHDNARPHVAVPVKNYLETLKWDILPHPPYSPDIVPSNYHLFRSMTRDLSEQHFRSYEECKKWVDSWIASKDQSFFQRGIRMLPERWEKVVANNGQYFEIPNSEQDIIVLNQNNKMKLNDYFASDKMLESVKLKDSTVEVIGFIDNIDGPKIVTKTQDRLLKFTLNNNSRHRIVVLIWNAEIERVQHHLKQRNIIHIDGAKATKPRISEHNQGTLPYVLMICTNTIIKNLGIFDWVKTIDLPNIPDYLNSCVLVRGYIKTNFNAFSNLSKMIGSITDGDYKLEIRISKYQQDIKFEKGQQVELKGYVKIIHDVFYLEVEKISDVKIFGKTLPFAQLLQGTKPIMKRTLPDNVVDSPSKRYKYN